MINNSKEAVMCLISREWIATMETLAEELGINRKELDNYLEPNDLTYIKSILESRKENTSITRYGMIDTSIVRIPNFIEYMKGYDQIIITDLTLDELNWLKDQDQENSLTARALLVYVQKNSNLFITKTVDRTLADDSDMILIQTAKKMQTESKNNMIMEIITADTGMQLRADLHGIAVKFLQHSNVMRVEKIKIDKVLLPDGLAKCTPTKKFLIKDGRGFNKVLPCQVTIDDRIFVVTKERIKKQHVVIFKELKLYSDNTLGIIVKAIFYPEDPYTLFSYKGSERSELEMFVKDFASEI